MTTAAWAGVLIPTTGLIPRLALGSDPRESLHRWSRRVLPALGISTVITGTPNLMAPLWVSNHLSWVDGLIFMSLRPMGTLAKGELASYPLLGRWARKAGLHFVQRDRPESRAAALVALATEFRNGSPMLLFPEGTTTQGQGLAPLHSGGLRAAWELKIPVQTFRLSSPTPHYPWTGDQTLVPHLSTLLSRGAKVRVAAGQTLFPSHYADSCAWLQAIQAALKPNGEPLEPIVPA